MKVGTLVYFISIYFFAASGDGDDRPVKRRKFDDPSDAVSGQNGNAGNAQGVGQQIPSGNGNSLIRELLKPGN